MKKKAEIISELEFFKTQNQDLSEHCENLTSMGRSLRRALISIYVHVLDENQELTNDSPAMQRAQRVIKKTGFFRV